MADATLDYTPEEIHAAFIAPLRSAMLIDDRFPLYSELLNTATQQPAPGAPTPDWSEVEELLRQCKQRGLMCDVENRYTDTEVALSRIETSDLLVLDYHLIASEPENGGPALDILCKLADSAHANLVVVYTAAADLQVVKRSVAAAFYGVPANPVRTDDYLNFSAEHSAEFTVDDIEGYLQSGYAGISGPTKGRNFKLLGKDPSDVLRQAMEDELKDKLQARQSDSAGHSDTAHEVNFSPPTEQSVWIAYKNVFVVVVQKGKQKDIFAELETALAKWNPSPLQLLLIHARNVLEKQGFLSDWNVLANSVRQTAFVYHFLAGGDSSPETRLKQLFRNVFGKVLDGLADEVANRGALFLKTYADEGVQQEGETNESLESRRLALAWKATRARKQSSKIDVLHELNNYLSSTEFVGSHLKTGTIFASVVDKPKKYWVCVTADCSLIPRKPSDKQSWEAEIHPNVPVVALRLLPETGKLMEHGLENATQCRHLFVSSEGQRFSLAIASEAARQPRPETFVLSEPVAIDAETNRFKASRIKRILPEGSDREVLAMIEEEFTVVAQLRPSYADRLLTQTGNHTTRIGVDFVSLSTSTVKDEDGA